MTTQQLIVARGTLHKRLKRHGPIAEIESHLTTSQCQSKDTKIVHGLLEKLDHILIPLSQAGFIKPDGKFTSYSDLKDQLFRRRFLVSGDSEEAQRSIFDEIPDKEIAIKLVDRYFQTYGSIFRFFNQSNFRAEAEKHWESPESVSLTFCIHLLLVIAIGNASIQPTEDRLPLTRITTWWHLIQAWQSVALRSDPRDITTLQSSFLISLMRQCYGLEALASWPSSGALVRNAMMAGLHRDPSSTGHQLDPEELVMHKNLWYTILELDLQSSMDEGMQPTLTPDDWDMPLPMMVSDHLDNAGGSQAISAVLVLISTLPVRLQIAHFLNNIKGSVDYNEAFILHEQLSPAAQLLLSSDSAHRSTSTAFTHGLPAALCARSLLALHIPFGSLRSPLYTFSHNISMSTAMSLMERLDPPQDKTGWPENDALVTLMRTSSSIFQTIAFQAILFICVQMESYFADPQSWTLVPELKERFAKILGRFIYIAEQRLPTQDFVGKAYMIPAMVLAHMRLANSGMSKDDMAANDAIIAEEVTTTCFSIFRNRPDLPSD
ncbi:hypothetical protein CGMCC3_g16116 [Colletotrichum fructicola]|nr:uncharacterized protein CGMCC3_g16116 [Colletotrichum fructicola]KAE9567728.1 hypothetical protein CGMCC3_g16116 [Colletotrichum fructicola]